MIEFEIDGERELAEGNDPNDAREYLLREVSDPANEWTLSARGVAFRVRVQANEPVTGHALEGFDPQA